MNPTTLQRIAFWWIAPALIGAGLGMVSLVAATWDCQIPACTHWFREALAFPARRCTTFALEAFGLLLGFEGAAPFALASTPGLGALVGPLVAWGVRRVRIRRPARHT